MNFPKQIEIYKLEKAITAMMQGCGSQAGT